MKILYSVQATGNGHISRAMELLPYLKAYGEVDVFLSGDNSSLALDAPIKYRSKGLSLFYNCNGGLNYWQMAKAFQPLRLRQEIRDLPVEKYDLVLNDFEHITAAACVRKNIPSVNFGHQASFQSQMVPRPSKKNPGGEWILKNYARATRYVGLHFKSYEDYIFTPVIRKDILNATPADGGYITVYLPSYCEAQLTAIFEPFDDLQFHIFCGQLRHPRKKGNITWLPVDKNLFSESFINCTGIITGGGFETPAEALHLGKKIMTIPIRSQYEQQCNAAALEQMGVLKLNAIDDTFAQHLETWMNSRKPVKMDYSESVPDCLNYLFNGSMMQKESGVRYKV